ncbi:GNAT family N-acetyltransferase [Ramlibacter albus]|uniref:GNAT family N-acetyltransferase n=1 Tax=Ramlibacter albus TaxID=2079448 RepID=A0A923M9Y8_9BURK|nr:GNAT family N-acetyltransferase [Ramlibacter albus]MBC5766533.1 GNAT family N-acetyltransferase [Ramlibacter albus]
MKSAALEIRAAQPTDFAAVLALNDASVKFLSALSAQRLQKLHEQSALHVVAQVQRTVVGFLLAFRERSGYDSINYRWFDSRHDRFLYIDRVVVSDKHRGHGIGAALYRHVFDQAAREHVPWVTCEFDVDPPNPASERFHAHYGFREVGRQSVDYADKVVALQAAPVRL